MSRGSWTMCNLFAEGLKIHGTIFSCYVFFRKRFFNKKLLTAEIRDFYEGEGASWRREQTTGTIEV
jgi:hypothetical protein